MSESRVATSVGLRRGAQGGLTLVEVMLGALVLGIGIAALLLALISQVALNEHARNVSFATEDANRVLEEIRERNGGAGCPPVTTCTPSGCATRWDAWLSGAGGGKSLGPALAVDELVAVTCQDNGLMKYCEADQMGENEWHAPGGPAGPPDDGLLRVTVAVCWRHRDRVIGECAWDGMALLANDADGSGVIESPVMIATVVACRE